VRDTIVVTESPCKTHSAGGRYYAASGIRHNMRLSSRHEGCRALASPASTSMKASEGRQHGCSQAFTSSLSVEQARAGLLPAALVSGDIPQRARGCTPCASSTQHSHDQWRPTLRSRPQLLFSLGRLVPQSGPALTLSVIVPRTQPALRRATDSTGVAFGTPS
jgi:hypothetical protein